MLINRSKLYIGWLQSAEDVYGYPFDMVTIAHTGPIVTKILSAGLATAKLPCLRKPHCINPHSTELIR